MSDDEGDNTKVRSLADARVARILRERPQWTMCRRDPATMWPPHNGNTCYCVPVLANDPASREDRRVDDVEWALKDLAEVLPRFASHELATLRAMVEEEIARRPPSHWLT